MSDQAQTVGRQSAEAPQLVLAEVDAEGRLTSSSPNLEALLGRPGAEILGTSLQSYLQPGSGPADEVRTVAGPHAARTYLQKRAPRAEGGWTVALADITDRVVRRAKLAAFEQCLEYAPDAVFWLGPDGRFTYVNQQARESLGYEREELMSLTLADIDPDYARRAFSLDWKVYDTLTPGEMKTTRIETFHKRRDGTIFPAEVVVRHRRTEDGHLHAAFVRDASTRREAERHRYLMDAAIERASTASFWARPDARLFHVNDAACELLGYSREELLQMHIFDVDPEYPPGAWRDFWPRLRAAKSMAFETTHQSKEGLRFPVEILANYIVYEGEEFCFSFARDLREERALAARQQRLEEQLHQAQKMDAIGRLAGGVAHDFNNMLGVILGYAEMLKEDLQEQPEAVVALAEIERAAQRSRDMTRQLLTFSRRQAIQLEVLDLNRHLREAERTIKRLIREDIQIDFRLAEGLWPVLLDASQLDQIIVNLVVNARDAMPRGGRLLVETANVRASQAQAIGWADEEDLVHLAVRDDGVGMEQEVVANAFEPFFTTKRPGRGTGLGLATVYAIADQHGGVTRIESEVGKGTCVNVYLPRTRHGRREGQATPAPMQVIEDKTILVVEDEPTLLRMTAQMLIDLGYHVHTCGSAREALALCGQLDTRLDLVVSDVVMPDMHGPELRAAVALSRPWLPFLFISGYAADSQTENLLPTGAHLLPKPFSKRELAQEVNRALLVK